MKCSYCGYDLKNGQGYATRKDGFMCEDCFDLKAYVQCAHCRRAIERELQDRHGDPICKTCFGLLGLITCPDCNQPYYSHDMFKVNKSGFACIGCIADEYHTCEACNGYYDSDHMSYTRPREICAACAENYDCCVQCGAVEHTEDLHYHEYEGPYCIRCEAYNMRAVIHAASYKPAPVFYGLGSKIPYYGIELEIDDGEDRQTAANDIMDVAGEFLYYKTDGSLSSEGLELVSHPASLDYHMHRAPWKKIFRAASVNGYKSHNTDTCGLHIHVDRHAFGYGSQVCEDLTIAKVIILIDRFYDDELVNFARRDYDKMCEWASKPDADIYTSDDAETAVDKALRTSHKGRYQAVNLTNSKTIEFRFFRGTLDYTTFIAAIQFLEVLITYCRDNDLLTVCNAKFRDVFHSDHGFSELKKYLKKRGL